MGGSGRGAPRADRPPSPRAEGGAFAKTCHYALGLSRAPGFRSRFRENGREGSARGLAPAARFTSRPHSNVPLITAVAATSSSAFRVAILEPAEHEEVVAYVASVLAGWCNCVAYLGTECREPELPAGVGVWRQSREERYGGFLRKHAQDLAAAGRTPLHHRPARSAGDALRLVARAADGGLRPQRRAALRRPPRSPPQRRGCPPSPALALERVVARRPPGRGRMAGAHLSLGNGAGLRARARLECSGLGDPVGDCPGGCRADTRATEPHFDDPPDACRPSQTHGGDPV